jgi:hypothetical protein
MANWIGRRRFVLGNTALAVSAVSPSPLFACQTTPELESKGSLTEPLVLLGIIARARAADENCFSGGHRGASTISVHLKCNH